MQRVAIRLVALIATLLVLGGIANALTWPAIHFLLIRNEDRPFVDGTYRVLATREGSEAYLRAKTYPVITRQPDRVCVEVLTRDGYWRYHACYNHAGTKLLDEGMIVF